MRALLISPDGVTEIDLPEDQGPNDCRQVTAMREAIGCRLLTGAGYPDRAHACWADDESMFGLQSGSLVSTVSWYPQELVGNLLVTGFDLETGETTAATMTCKALEREIKVGIFIRPEDMGDILRKD